MDHFYRHPATADGHLGKCKDCTKRDVKLNREKRANYYRAYDRQRFHEDGRRREYVIAKSLKRIGADPLKRKARLAVSNAVRDGRLEKPKICSRCGKGHWRLEGHHHRGYSEAYMLDVVWLCPACHREVENP